MDNPPKTPKNPKWLKPFILVLVIIGLLLGGYAASHQSAAKLTAVNKAGLNKLGFNPVKADGTVLSIDDNSSLDIKQLENEARNYQQDIGSVRVNITKMPLPPTFQTDMDAFTKYAAGHGATEPLKVKSGDGFAKPQSLYAGGQFDVIRTSRSLIMAQATQTVSDSTWQQFLDNLN